MHNKLKRTALTMALAAMSLATAGSLAGPVSSASTLDNVRG